MDTIKKYFTQSIIDDGNKSMDGNDESSFNTIYKNTQDIEVCFLAIMKERAINLNY